MEFQEDSVAGSVPEKQEAVDLQSEISVAARNNRKKDRLARALRENIARRKASRAEKAGEE